MLPSNRKQLFRLLSRLTVFLVSAVWWGGLTFYAVVVVPSGAKVLGGEIEQGFVTRVVAPWINLFGLLAALIVAVDAVRWWGTLRESCQAEGQKSAAADRSNGTGNYSRLVQWGFAVSWLTMLGTQIVLCQLYPQLDAMLSPESREIADPGRFHSTHEFYLTIVGVQWSAAIVMFAAILSAWQAEDSR